MQIPRKITSYGNSSVIVVDTQTKEILGVEEGDIVYLSKKPVENQE